MGSCPSSPSLSMESPDELAGSAAPAPPNRRVSMRDVARAVGVSVAAVSLALRNSPRISGPVRQKIQAKLQEMGYEPDPMLAALSHYRRSKSDRPIGAELAWINYWPEPGKLRSFQEFDLYWEGAYAEARANGYRLEEFRFREYETVARLEKVLRARSIRGILLPPKPSTVDIRWGDFHWDDYCIVRFGHSITAPRVHLVTSDQLTDGMIAFDNVWSKGYRRIAYVTTQDTAVRGARFSAGFLQGQLKVRARVQLRPLLLGEDQDSRPDAKRMTAWLRKNKPDAIITNLPYLSGLLKKCGYRVPRDIGLAVTSVLDAGARAGIDQNSREIGRAATQLLISLINHNERGIPEICREVLIEGRWVDGDTLPSKK
jgi:LacI family transcriptional regulator